MSTPKVSRTLNDLPLLEELQPTDVVHMRRGGTDYKVKIQTLSDPSLFGGDRTYVHDQMSPQEIWTITHGMNKFPSVAVVDSANTSVIGDLQYIDTNTVQITFSGPFSGKAYLN
jgi:hypothetical protein